MDFDDENDFLRTRRHVSINPERSSSVKCLVRRGGTGGTESSSDLDSNVLSYSPFVCLGDDDDDDDDLRRLGDVGAFASSSHQLPSFKFISSFAV